jgi:uncharacterized protein YjdB
VNSSGLITAVAIGSATITASYDSQSVQIPVNVTAVPVTVSSITLSQTGTIQMFPGEPAQNVTATANMSDSTTQDITSLATWTSSDTSVATVTTSGAITAVATGTSTITASYGGQTATVSVNVTAINSIGILSPSGINTFGQTTVNEIGTPVPGYKVDVVYNNFSHYDGTSVATYTSSDPTVATMDNTGTITPNKWGTVTITVSYEGQTTTLNVTVIPSSITVSPTTATMNISDTQQITVTAQESTSNTVDITSIPYTTYASSNTGVATVDSSGKITAVSAGTATISAYAGTSVNRPTATVSVTVSAPTLSGLSLTNTGIHVGSYQGYTVFAVMSDSTTQDVTDQLTWTSSDTSIATVSNGVVTGISAGTATITASYGALSTSMSVTILP